MKTIWKYKLPYEQEFAIAIPRGAEILIVETQYGHPQSQAMTMWVLVDPQQPTEQRHFRLGGTGGPLPDDPGTYLGTCKLNADTLVFHIFEVG